MNLKQAMQKWHVTETRARKYCKELDIKKQKGAWVIPDDTFPPVSIHDIGVFVYEFIEFRNNRPQSFDWAACGTPSDTPQRNLEFLRALQYITPYDINSYDRDSPSATLDDFFLTERAMSLLGKPKRDSSFAFASFNGPLNLSLISVALGGANL